VPGGVGQDGVKAAGRRACRQHHVAREVAGRNDRILDAGLRHQIGTYLVVENAGRRRFALLLVKV
jgi:hypothetical protein